jgi:hypothetical protein
MRQRREFASEWMHHPVRVRAAVTKCSERALSQELDRSAFRGQRRNSSVESGTFHSTLPHGLAKQIHFKGLVEVAGPPA